MKHFCAAVTFGLGLAATGAAQQPPAALEFYGYARNGSDIPQLAFLRQGEGIIIAAEGDLFQDVYRLVRIGTDSVVIEHTSDQHRQTLPLTMPKGENNSSAVEPASNAVQPSRARSRRRSVNTGPSAEQ